MNDNFHMIITKLGQTTLWQNIKQKSEIHN